VTLCAGRELARAAGRRDAARRSPETGEIAMAKPRPHPGSDRGRRPLKPSARSQGRRSPRRLRRDRLRQQGTAAATMGSSAGVETEGYKDLGLEQSQGRHRSGPSRSSSGRVSVLVARLPSVVQDGDSSSRNDAEKARRRRRAASGAAASPFRGAAHAGRIGRVLRGRGARDELPIRYTSSSDRARLSRSDTIRASGSPERGSSSGDARASLARGSRR